MPIPAQYSEDLFADDMVSWLGELADVLGWTSGSPQVRQALVDTLLTYGTIDITTITVPAEINVLRALGRRAIWKAVADATTGYYSFTDVAQQKFDRDKVHKQAVARQEQAGADCREAGAIGLSVGRLTLDFLEPASEWR